MKLSEFIAHVRKEVNDPLLDSACPMCYNIKAISNQHLCDWKSFYFNFKDKPEYLIEFLLDSKASNSPSDDASTTN